MRINKTIAFILLIVFTILHSFAEVKMVKEDCDAIQPLRTRVGMMENWWQWKYKNVLPMVMKEQKVDLWIIRDDEADLYYNNQGPVYVSLLLADHQGMALPSKYARPGSQRLPEFLMFHNTGKEIKYIEPKNYKQISELVNSIDPRRIAIAEHNNSRLLNSLEEKFSSRTVNSWTLGVRWLETVGEERVSVYRHVQRVANEIIAEAFSNRVVVPDVTTTGDLNWWVLHKYQSLGLDMENYPSIIVQRNNENMKKYREEAKYFRNGRSDNSSSVIIRRGDVVSCDTDLYMYGLITDSHQHAYVLRGNEIDVPEKLKNALLKVNKMQDLFKKEFKYGRTGKEIVAASKKIKWLDGVIDSELGFHPPPMYIWRFWLGGYMFDRKSYVAGMTSGPGYYPTSIVTNNHKLHLNTLYAFEPHTRIRVSGWKYGVELGIGQITIFNEKGLNYLSRPQESEWHIIK